MPGWVARLRGQAAYVVVMVVLVGAIVYMLVEPGHWRRGVAIIAVSVLLAAALRLVLPEPVAGMLAVRRRWLDVVVYAALGVLILFADIRLTS